MARKRRRRESSNSNRQVAEVTGTAADPVRDGKWVPSGGSLFLHSHVYDPDGVTPGDGLSGISDESTRSTASAFDVAAAHLRKNKSIDPEKFLQDEVLLGPLAKLIGVQAGKLASG